MDDMANKGRYFLGVDIGGTFTDLVVYDTKNRTVQAAKVASNRAAPDKAVLAAMEKCGVPDAQLDMLVHGTTVATNALLERRGAKTAFVTSEGFRDVLELGRTTRLVPNTLYDPYFVRPAPLVDRRWRRTVRERVAADGAVETEVDDQELRAVAQEFKEQGIEAVCVGFINSYRNARNEEKARGILSEYFDFVTVSTGVINEVREFERFSACSINGYVMPLMARYSQRLSEAVKTRNPRAAFFTVASHGGLLSTPAVATQPVRTILSGPAAGIAATVHLARTLGLPNLVTYDMGGTSTDVALVHDYRFPLKTETILDGLIVKLPQLDIHTVGAGGGSIAAFDSGGGLQVGPESAGADPGPASYGLGGERPTVTDANVVLRRLGAGQELGKSLRIDATKAEEAMERAAAAAGLGAREMADAVLKLAVAKMAAAVREISIMRGFDPREFSLLCYGGAGPLHAALVAEEAGMSEVVVPPNPGTFSAFGTLCSAPRRDQARTIMATLGDDALQQAWRACATMAEELAGELAREGVDGSGQVLFEYQFDMRYQGQAHELTVAVPNKAGLAEVSEVFEAAFEREYGRRDTGRDLELVNARVVACLPFAAPEWGTAPTAGAGSPDGERRLVIDNRDVTVPVWQRESLTLHSLVEGPAVVEEMSSTTYVPPGWRLRCGEIGELRLTRR